MNSLLRTWQDKDKIDYFFCVDDNSSKADRDKMRKKYPFFKYFMKKPEEKGHRQSMNIIWSKLKELKPKYWIHMEDDWLFFYEDDYVSRATSFLDRHETSGVHQLLFNRNYAELYEWDIVGGSKIEPGFLLHERTGVIPAGRRTNGYWPHYSFRPSMIRVAPILALGNYDSPNTFFERDYADRYTAHGYKSAFFDAITCFHTGKLTSDKTGTNAYSLNDENQFTDTIATYIINLERRPDRRSQVRVQMENKEQKRYSFFKAVDALQLKPTTELVRLFKGNDFNNRRTFIACAMSHYRLWQQLMTEKTISSYLIFEDDITLQSDYVEQYKKAVEYIKENKDVDFLFLGYSSRDPLIRDISGGFTSLAMDKYIGGFFSYIITRSGAEKMLKFISEKGIKHGIDYLVKIVPDLKCISLQPHIVHSEWVQALSSPVDSDIQKDFVELPLDISIDHWVFYPRLDHMGDDIQHVGRKSAEELNTIAEENMACMAYNTLGFLKNNVSFPLSSSPWFGATDGVFVRRSAIKRIKMLCNWCDSSDLLKEYGQYLANQPFDLTTDDTDIDYWIIINYPQAGEKYDPKRTFVFRMEPWCGESWQSWGGKTWGEWAKPDPTKFLYVHDLSASCTPVFWQLNTHCKDMLNESSILNKSADIACILSKKVFDPGHKHRLTLLRLAEEKGGLPIKVFGRENYHDLSSYIGPTTGPKENYIRPYKYYFMCENNAEPGYITEKLWEPILCESLCFYWGAPNVADYVDPRAYVQLDMSDYEAAYETIKKAIAEDWWSQRIEHIHAAKQKILRDLNLFSIVEKVIAPK
jgi:GR25 family glycosyltransferase involved in LPS biosynthesis